jgi:formate--tetrahydrofolate ligase
MNDRALRQVVVGLGGRSNGYPRETGFDITAASEVMAILAMARDLDDLRARLGAITVGTTPEGEPVTAERLRAGGAMTVLLREAVKPNLVQTLEGQPALVHAGPFANIAHGNSSLAAARIALKLSDYVVTEGGFASDLGLEKFLDIVCRTGGLTPSAVVLVATVRALEYHGGGDLEVGVDNLERHLGIARAFGLNAVVAVNAFPGDSKEKLERVRALALERGAWAADVTYGFEHGGAGARQLAETVADAAKHPSRFEPIYPLEATIPEKIAAIATRVYGAEGINVLPAARRKVEQFTKLGLDNLPICMAKTHLSLSHDPKLKNAPTGFTVPVRDIRPYTGAGWLVALCGEMQTMPGLGKHPAAFDIEIAADGSTVGLF